MPTPAWTPPAPDERIAVTGIEGGVDVALDFTSVGTLYRRYFGDEVLTEALAKGVGACTAFPVKVAITYDAQQRRGRVVGIVAAEALGCKAVVTDAGVDVSALTPLTRAVAGYRNAIGAAKDIRVYGFSTGLHVKDGIGGVTLWAEGQDPVDGSSFGRCVGVDGIEHCQPGEPHEGVTVLALPDEVAQARLVKLLTP